MQLNMLGDWTDRVAKGELPKDTPPRPVTFAAGLRLHAEEGVRDSVEYHIAIGVTDKRRATGKRLPSENQGSSTANWVCVVSPTNADVAPRRLDAGTKGAHGGARALVRLSTREGREELTGSERGRFLVLEGIDGCGKTTQLERLRTWLPQSGLMPQSAELVVTREPGGTELGLALRQLLLHPPGDAAPGTTAELLLYAADRAQHVQQRIEPALAAGHWVLSDRFCGSTEIGRAHV